MDPETTLAPMPWPTERPEFLAFLPMIYVAWSDGVLTPEELTALCGLLEEQSWLDQAGKEVLRSWLDPDSPPSPSAVLGLRNLARSLWPEDREVIPPTLAGLGLELIRASGLTVGPWSDEDAPRLLSDAEVALGVSGPDAVRAVLGVGARVRPRPARIRFDADGLNAFLEPSHHEIRRRLLELLATPELRLDPESDRTMKRSQTLEAVRTLAAEGFGALSYPVEAGGRADVGAAIATFETLAYGDLSVLIKYGVQFGLFGGSVLQLGTERHHRTFLERIGRLDLPGCYAMTEVGHGSNVREIETTAVYDLEAREFEIHTPSPSATKDWIGNAALHGRMATVFAQLEVAGEEHGVHAFLVPIRDESSRPLHGVTIEDRGPKIGLNGVDNGRIAFDHVRIPRENLLNRFADVSPEGAYSSSIPSARRRFFTMLGTLVAGRISIAAASGSVAKTALTIAIRHSARRRQFGPPGGPEVPILDHLHVQRALLPRLARTYAFHFAIRRLVERYAGARDDEIRAIEVLAAGLKAEASWHTIDTLQVAREMCGGEGYAAENQLGRLKNDADIFATFEGANPVLLQLVAKGLLSDFREEFGDPKLWGIVRYVAARAQTRVQEMNPVVTRRTDPGHLRSSDFHLDALGYREERLIASASRRIKRLLDEGEEAYDVMNDTQDHLIELARAHVDRVLFRALHDAVARAPSPGLSEVLNSLSALFALSTIERERGWYLEAGYMEPGKTRAVRSEVGALSRELKEYAVLLVDGFGIPDDVLKAPAGRSA